jgi:hypothetical protein
MNKPFISEYSKTPATSSWSNFTLSYTNLSLGTASTTIARQCIIGKRLHIYIQMTVGTSPVISGSPRFTMTGLPNNKYARLGGLFEGVIIQASTGNVYSFCGLSNTTTSNLVNVGHRQKSGSDVRFFAITQTNPITFASGDILILTGVIPFA